MNLSNFKLVTSNKRKLQEFQRFGLSDDLQMAEGPDIKEVDGSSVETILHKSFDNGPSTICEDTSFNPESGEGLGTNIRWQMDKLNEYDGQRAVWEVLLGVNDGENIQIFRGVVAGTIRRLDGVDKLVPKCFGFDGQFVPDGYESSLYELDLIGEKDNTSARKKAVEAMLAGDAYKTYSVHEISPWKGKYQNESLS